MASVRVSYENKRGCGYRKPGGLYLVSGKPTAPCGKLPLPLHTCPTCSTGIKPQRSFAWIQPRPLFAAVECRQPQVDVYRGPLRVTSCAMCPAGGAIPERAGLVWIGGAFYETAEAFMAEARVMGISRRIPVVPKGFVPGETWIYLAHRQVVCPNYEASFDLETQTYIRGVPAIFSAFVPHAVEYVVKGTETEDELTKIEKRGISLVEVRQNQVDLPLDATPAERAMVPDA